MTALTILLIIMVIELALVICLLLRHDYDDCKNCNRHDKLPTYYHPKYPNNNEEL